MKRIIIILSFILAIASFADAQRLNSSPQPSVKEEGASGELSVIYINNKLKVSNVPEGSKIEIYSVVGIKVAEVEYRQGVREYALDLAKGYYIVRIGEAVCKIAIR
jgi:hypothetical protein